MVYTDRIHLIADSLEELHEFANKIGLKKCWFHGKRHKHYDLRPVMLQKVLDEGAVVVSSKEIIKILNNDRI